MMNALLQAGAPWHREGLFIGVHWAWWIFWIATLAALAWALCRWRVERRETRGDAERGLAAEEVLRRRFDRGEMDEDQYLRELASLQEVRLP
jgi:uncharacterized membrane protein